MSITRSQRRQTYTVIDNNIINDERLPLDSAFLLVYLLSKPDNWQVNSSYLQARFNCGRNRIYRMLGDLQGAGYASYHRNADGKTDWNISETRIDTPHTQNRDKGEKPHPQKPHEEKPHEDIGHVLVNTERAVNTDKQITTDGQSEFDRFWQAYPKKVQKKPTEKIWQKLKAKPEFTDLLIRDIQERLQEDDNWIRGYIPNPTTYLNQERWTDDLVQSPKQQLTDADRYGLQQQRNRNLLSAFDACSMGEHDPALPPPMAEDQW